MNLKLVMAVSLFAAIPVLDWRKKDEPATKAPMRTVEDAQKLVRTISSDRAKLKAYCDMGKLQEQMDQAEQNNDHEALEILDAKIDSLSQQIGPDYVNIMDGLDASCRPASLLTKVEARRIAANIAKLSHLLKQN
jgi:hypothetical protein